MADLRDYLGLGTTGATVDQFAVYHTSTDSVYNGGCCCRYVVPDGISAVHVELWGGGGSGSGACRCAWQATGAMAGGYSMKKINVSAGTVLTICAGSSGCCSSCCYCGWPGYPSFVLCNGSNVACAAGGCGGVAECCWYSFGCYGIWCVCQYCPTQVGDITIGMNRGLEYTSSWCADDMFGAFSGSPKLAQNNRLTNDMCVAGYATQGCGRGSNHFPGGGGSGGGGCGDGYCWGGFSAGGLAVVTIYG